MNWTPTKSPQITKFYVGEIALSLGSKDILITNSHKKLLVFCLGNQTLHILVVTPNKKAAQANLKDDTTTESLREWQKTFQNFQKSLGKFSESWFH